MSNIQERLDELQPYVLSIRYFQGKTPVVDAVFRDGWSIPEVNGIQQMVDDNNPNHYVFASADVTQVSIDSLLDHVENIINTNLEREQKHQLLVNKVEELKEFFANHRLKELKNLKFVIDDKENEINDLINNSGPLPNKDYSEEEVQEIKPSSKEEEIDNLVSDGVNDPKQEATKETEQKTTTEDGEPYLQGEYVSLEGHFKAPDLKKK